MLVYVNPNSFNQKLRYNFFPLLSYFAYGLRRTYCLIPLYLFLSASQNRQVTTCSKNMLFWVLGETLFHLIKEVKETPLHFGQEAQWEWSPQSHTKKLFLVKEAWLSHKEECTVLCSWNDNFNLFKIIFKGYFFYKATANVLTLFMTLEFCRDTCI